jgi:hypothetical protein
MSNYLHRRTLSRLPLVQHSPVGTQSALVLGMPSSYRKNGTDRFGAIPWWRPIWNSQGPALIFNVQGQVGHLKNFFTAFEHELLYIQSVLLSLNILKIIVYNSFSTLQLRITDQLWPRKLNTATSFPSRCKYISLLLSETHHVTSLMEGDL